MDRRCIQRWTLLPCTGRELPVHRVVLDDTNPHRKECLRRKPWQGNLKQFAGTQITLCIACASDPGGCAASTVGATIVEETCEGGNIKGAVGNETLIKGTRVDATQAQHRNVIAFDRIFHVCSVEVVVDVVAAQDEEHRQNNCKAEECEKSVKATAKMPRLFIQMYVGNYRQRDHFY